MAGNHKIIRINAPQPTVASGEHALYMTVYDPDTGGLQTLYVSMPDASWKDPETMQAAMCEVDSDLEFC
jgi:hypothetical protein